ncbi:MAG TPA: hypothetical protein VFB75_11120 [Burkholderiales bacterium]|nr:hypothetical protein [Burkholderiales bacterium]
MAIGVRELILIAVVMLAAMGLLIGGIVWLVGTVSKRSAAERLAELESLRKADRITAAEYEKQRAAIVSNV